MGVLRSRPEFWSSNNYKEPLLSVSLKLKSLSWAAVYPRILLSHEPQGPPWLQLKDACMVDYTTVILLKLNGPILALQGNMPRGKVEIRGLRGGCISPRGTGPVGLNWQQ